MKKVTKRRKGIALIIALLMVFTCVPSMVFAEDAVTDTGSEQTSIEVVEETEESEETLGGEGTADSPYLVTSYDDLLLVANNPGAYYKQTCNIDLNYEKITLFPNKSITFTGVYDGNNKIISNMAAHSISIFGHNDGTIKNLTVKNVKTTKSGFVTFGTFAIRNAGLISNCHVNTITVNAKTSSGYIGEGGICASNSGTIENCSVNNGSIKGIIAGGIVAENSGVITGCSSNIKITAHVVGGIVAENLTLTTISNCKYSGSIVMLGNLAGGIAAKSFYSNISNCKMTGSIKASSGLNNQYIGGILGQWYTDSFEIEDEYYSDVYLKNCSTSGSFVLNSTKFSKARYGGIVGLLNVQDDICVTIDNCSFSGNAKMLVTGTGYLGGIVGVLSNPLENTVRIQNCNVSGLLSKIPSKKISYNIIAGGIAGYGETAKIYKCKSTMTVKGNSVGCIVGSAQDELIVDTCLATGTTEAVTTLTAKVLPTIIEPVYAASSSSTAIGRVAGVFNGSKIRNTYYKSSSKKSKAVGKKKSGSVSATKYSKYSFAKTKVSLKKGKNIKINLNRSDSLKKKTVTYSTNNKKIATVSKAGRIYAKSPGTTYIKATIGGILTTSIKVTVTK